jgi:glycosyltransferase involved in cell wall biosynthesis
MNNEQVLKSINSADSINNFDVICLSHLRWDFVYQRPQHLMSRFARNNRVFFFEEPIFSDEPTRLDISRRENNLYIAVPRISHSDRETQEVAEIERMLLEDLIKERSLTDFVLWFYTPMAMDYAGHLSAKAVVFDCMDELSAFKNAPPKLLENERKLIEKADLVYTGGQSLYEAKKDKHPRAYAFPSSIDVAHFETARAIRSEPKDQAAIANPKLGFCGVIDERMNIGLLAEMAETRPDWQFVMIGPVVKISEEDLPRRENIHYLGSKDYKDLPAYLSGWDIALMPFAINESTKYISPTKTPEYLAAGLPVISTAIRDVVTPYGEQQLVHIADDAAGFIKAAEDILENGNAAERIARADEFLSGISWDKTWNEINDLIAETINKKPKAAKKAV